MNKMHYIFAAAAALLLLSACSRELKTRTFEYEDSAVAELFDSECNVSCSFEYVTGGVSEALKDKINASIVATHILYDEADGLSDVPVACERWVAATLESYEADIEDFSEDYDEGDAWMFNFEYSRTGRFGDACKSRHLQTYNVSYNEYTGGAHGMYSVVADVYDLTTGEIISEDDLFAEDFQSGVKKLLAAAMEAYLADNDADPEMLFSTPEPNGNFCVSDTDVTWIYNPYEIAPYAMGVIELSVSWDDLKPFLL
ncbi:MAG: RsiV family protein [Bacteroidales bacterium]|nr:RsiV family protein [Bacteroidales bacterium]